MRPSTATLLNQLRCSVRQSRRSLYPPTKRSLSMQPRSPFFAFSHQYQPRNTFFTPSFRSLTTLAAPISPIPLTTAHFTPEATTTIPRSLPNWLFGCSALVFGIIVVGGLTRLTESGLSITEWEPITGILPPITQAEWDVEWEKYRVSPEGILTNSKMDMSEFKKIFYMEWAHRVAGRTLGVAFILPTIYYMTRYRLPRSLQVKLLAIGLGIGAQGALGWFMVKSGLDEQIVTDKAVPRVSQYRLAAHLGAALTLYMGMVSTAIGLRQHVKGVNALRRGETLPTLLRTPALGRFKGIVHLAYGMVFFTAVSGAFVAGLDAGLVYNEFPTMGGRLVPPTDELLDRRYAQRADKGDTWWRNMLENPVTAQFDHRLFATATFSVLLSLPFLARAKALRTVIPLATKRLSNLTAAAAIGQVTMGITTLLYLVPVPLAAMHQAGSVVLLTCLMALGGTLKRPGKALQLMQQSVKRR